MLPLTDRGKDILRLVVKDYIMTGEPVGSRTVAKESALNLCPATIRNVMADLEDMGLLYQPHASAGRLPTAQGLRLYIENLLEREELTPSEQEEIRSTYAACHADLQQLMRGTCRLLSAFSRYTGIVMAPPLEETVCKRIEFIRIGSKHVLVVFVTATGFVQNRIVEMDEDLSQAELSTIAKYLNEIMVGLTLRQVRERLVEEMRREKLAYDELLQKTLQLGSEVAQVTEERDIYIEGQARILDEPSFADVERLKELFKAFEEKSILVSLLDRSMKADGVHTLFGSECGIAGVEGCSLITSTYHYAGRPVGILGVIGPMRMNYGRVIPVVEYTARVLSDILNAEWGHSL